MKVRSYNAFFPTPTSLSMSSVGIDLSDRSLRFAEIKPSGEAFELGRYGSMPVPEGAIETGKIKDPEKIKAMLRELKEKEDFSFVRVSIPEEQAYLFSLVIPKVAPDEIRNTIELQIEEHIPIKAEECVFDFSIVRITDTNISLIVAALPKEVSQSYLDIFLDAGLVPLSFEIEPMSVARSVVKAGDIGTYMVVDFGQTRTGISIVSNGSVFFTSTLDINGEDLTRIIQRSFGISFEEAENVKQSYGMRRQAESQNELFAVLLNTMSILRDELNKHYIYWHTYSDPTGIPRPKIEKIFFCGGNANLPGLIHYISTSMRVKAELGNVWTNVNNFEEYIPPIYHMDSMGYGTAIGLALSDFYYD